MPYKKYQPNSIVRNKRNSENIFSGIVRLLKKILIYFFILLIKLYQYCISPFTSPACRYSPTCSQYALEAIRKYGPLKGLWLAIKRISRCHPWGKSGYDPVP